MSRARLVASGAFLIVYLLVQTVYPALAWVLPGDDHFTGTCTPVGPSARSFQ